MQYATATDFIRLFQLDLNGTSDYPVSEADRQAEISKINQALRSASEELNLYIGARYALPLETWNDFVKDSCCRIARKLMDAYSDREKVRLDYEDAIKAFKQVAAGTLLLFDLDGNPLPEKTTIQTIAVAPITVCDRAVRTIRIQF